MIDNFHGANFYLSNFFPCKIRIDGFDWPSTEHAYQAAKTLDENEKFLVKMAKTAGDAKRMGRKLTLRPDWNEVKIDVMRNIVREKFMQNNALASMLMDTGDQELIEGNTWNDTFWGVCNGVGENWLGKILMEVRSEFYGAEVS